MNKFVVELIGTFFLVFTIGCSVIGNVAGPMAPIAIGFALMVMVFAGGHISGAHYNPAVTLGVWMRGKCATRELPVYWIAQIVGAGLAAAAVKFLKAGIVVQSLHVSVVPALLAEFLFTFALVYVVLNVATADGTANNSFYGLAIGSTVTAGAYTVGNISGAVFNPAVALGISAMGMLAWGEIWIYLVANFAAAIAAAMVFKAVNPPLETKRAAA